MSGRGAERILHVIEWMAAAVRPVAFTEVVNALALPKSSALDLLRILVDAGYAERLEDGRYRLLRVPGEPIGESLGWGTLLRFTDAPLRDAVARTAESGFIAVLGDDRNVNYIAKVLPQREIYYDRDVTVPRRPHQVSSGIILLGGLGRDALYAYAEEERIAGRLTETNDQLAERVKTAFTSGIQVNRLGVVEGAGGMAVPIRSRDGKIIAALNIAGPAARLAGAVDEIEPVLREVAGIISKSLNWDNDPSGAAAIDAA